MSIVTSASESVTTQPCTGKGPAMTTETLERPAAASTVDFDLDVTIVTAGPTRLS